jgi:Cyclic nucleotide-binding domain/Major Facilitator Superfamily
VDDAPAQTNRWAVFRNALANPNIAKVESSVAAGVIGNVAWLSTMLVITYHQLGLVGPGWFIMVRQIAGALSAPVYAALAGRFRRERVLASSIVARGIAVALVIPVLELHAGNALLFFAIALEGFAQSAPKALNDALLPWLADSPAQLVAANAIMSLLETAGVSAGAGVAAVALKFSGPTAALTTVAVLCALGALPLFAISGIDTRVGNDGARILTELAGGIGVLRRSLNARVVIVVMALTGALTGIAQSLVAGIATDLLHMGADGTPVLIVAVGVGGLIGGISSLSLARRSISLPLVVSLVGCALALFALTVTSAEVVALPVLCVLGIGIAYQLVCGHTLLQRSASGRSLDLVVGINALIVVTITGVAAQCAGQLSAAIGVRGTLWVAVGLAVLGAAYALWRLTRLDGLSPVEHEELDAIRSVPAFGPLSVAAANQLASALVSLQSADGDVVVRQGEAAEDMFLIASGIFGAEVDGQQVRTLQQGDHFGEIALLFHTARTGTVRCLQAGTLWRLRREDFLRAITGNSATQETMQAIADQRLAHAGSIGPVDGNY